MTHEVGQPFYRYHAYTYFMEGGRAHVSIDYGVWKVVKVNPQSVWVERHGLRKIVYNGADRKWAYPTKEEAWRSFEIRCRWRRQHWKNEGHRLDAIEKTVAEGMPTAGARRGEMRIAPEVGDWA